MKLLREPDECGERRDADLCLEGRPLGEFTLTDPLDAVFLDDRRIFHDVTPIAPLDSASKACRDVLVLTYRREESPSGKPRALT
jgi:hypothetical protein